MELNFKNKSLSDNLRVSVTPKNTVAKITPASINNPTAKIDDDGELTFCLSPYVKVEISCEGATPSTGCIEFEDDGRYDFYIGDDLTLENATPAQILALKRPDLNAKECKEQVPDFIVYLPEKPDEVEPLQFPFPKIIFARTSDPTIAFETSYYNLMFGDLESFVHELKQFFTYLFPEFDPNGLDVIVSEYVPSYRELPFVHRELLERFSPNVLTGESIEMSPGSPFSRSWHAYGVNLIFNSIPAEFSMLSTTHPIYDNILADSPWIIPPMTMTADVINYRAGGEVERIIDPSKRPIYRGFDPRNDDALLVDHPIAIGAEFTVDASTVTPIYVGDVIVSDHINVLKLSLPPFTGTLELTIEHGLYLTTDYDRRGWATMHQPISDGEITSACAFTFIEGGPYVMNQVPIDAIDSGHESDVSKYKLTLHQDIHGSSDTLYIALHPHADIKMRFDNV